MEERWVAIEGINRNYQVSDLGRVRTFLNSRNGHILKQRKDRRNRPRDKQYMVVNLFPIKYGKMKVYKVHRLVAKAFILNPYKKKEVNHLFGNKMDNRAVALDWVTRSENRIHAIRTGLVSFKNMSKPVIQKNKNGGVIKLWPSMMEASRNGYNESHIGACCRNIRKTHKKCFWEFATKK